MILLLDVEKQIITLYKAEGAVEIPFAQAGSLYNHLNDDNVLYVTNAMEVNASDVVSMIKGMGVDVREDAVQDTGIKYLHGTSQGTIYIDEDLKFEGPWDCKVVDEHLAAVIRGSQILQDLIRTKKIEVIGEATRRKLMGDFKQFQEKQLEKQQLIDAQLDSMILKEKVSDWDGTIGGSNEHDDAVSIEIGGAGRVGTGGGVGPTFNTMSELLDAVDGLEG